MTQQILLVCRKTTRFGGCDKEWDNGAYPFTNSPQGLCCIEAAFSDHR